MRFDGMLQRAKEKKIKLLLIRLNPQAKIYATLPDKEITKAFGVGLMIAAKKFAENSNGKLTEEQVFEAMLADIGRQGMLAMRQESLVKPEDLTTPAPELDDEVLDFDDDDDSGDSGANNA